MPQPKKDQELQSKQSGPGVNFTRILPAAVTQNELGSHLPNPGVLSLYQTSKKLKGFFQSRVDALKPLKCAVEGDVEALMALIQDNPGLLFKKGEVKAPRGQTYYNLSPYMLMKFLCDEDMLAHIMPLIPEGFNRVTQAQDAELGCGGSDLVKLDFDPMLVAAEDFNKIIEFKTKIEIKGTSTAITFPLLENPDGLLFWKNDQGEVNFYYTNRETQTVIPITPRATTPEEQQALDAFKDSFDEMENNSARRSTNKEHQLIVTLMQRTLHRQGIHYSDAYGEHYCDSHTPFQLINHYRTYMRLYEEAVHNGQRDKVDHYWREGVGIAQGEEMWLLQRICEASRPFHPLPQNFDEFKRGFVVYNWRVGNTESVFNGERLVDDLGSKFALYKGSRLHTMPHEHLGARFSAGDDLMAVCRLVEDAKTKILGCMLESDHVLQPASSAQR